MRILMASSVIPFPPVGGGHLRTYHLLRSLAARHDVTLVGFSYGGEIAAPPFPVRVVVVPWEEPALYRELSHGDALSSQQAYEALDGETSLPWFVSYFESAAMEETLERVAGEGFDLILIETSQMARFLSALPAETPKLLDFWNVETLVTQRHAEEQAPEDKAGAVREAEKMRRFEKQAALQCALCLTVSELEAQAARALLGIERVQVIPNGVDTSFFTPVEGPAESGNLLFTGTMNYPPNIGAVQYFVREVLPLIQRRLPQARLHVVGARATAAVTSLASETVVVHGQVPDLRPYYRSAQIVVVPLLHGGGTRLKILEAAASGKAIVSTSIGAEGLDFVRGQEIIIADAAPEFAEAVIALAGDEVRRRELERRARTVARQYDWETIGSRLHQIIDEVRVMCELAGT